MKTRTFEVLVVMAILAVFSYIVFGVAAPVPNPKRNLRDFIYQTPSSIYQEFGYSEETELFYNIVTLKEIVQKYEVRIKALETQIAELATAQELMQVDLDILDVTVVDPNE